ncbi:hypothetical protein GCM10020000_60640 [Streptomyces olivoverticillatus]
MDHGPEWPLWDSGAAPCKFVAAMTLAFIPSPSTGVVHLGPIPLRGYAFCIIIGVFVAVWLGNRRWIARGGRAGTVADIAVWAVPFGLLGGRLYHVITDYELYFGEGRNWVNAFKIWEGGLGIWGAVALGAVGAWIGCRRRGIPLLGLGGRPRPPASPWPRPSAAGATGSTRSSTASPPICPGP